MGCQFYRVIIIFPPPWLKQGWLIHKFFFGGGTLKDDTLIIFRSNHILLIQVQINSSLLMYYIQDLRKVWKSRGGDGTNLGWEGHNLPLWLRWPNQNIDPEPFMLLMGREYEWTCPTVNSNVYICFQSRGGGASSNLEGLSSLLVWLGLFELPQLPISM